MKVEIFSDVACPYCFIGKRNFEKALESFEVEPVEVIWRSFQLNPGQPRGIEQDMHDYLAAKYGVSREEAVAMNDRMLGMAGTAGIRMDLERARPRNTFDAHRMLQLGVETGRAGELAELLFSAYFTGSVDIENPDSLIALATEAGIDPDAAAEVAVGDRFGDRVRADQEEAAALGLSAVPAFVFDRAFLVSGAQPPELMGQALEEAAATTA